MNSLHYLLSARLESVPPLSFKPLAGLGKNDFSHAFLPLEVAATFRGNGPPGVLWLWRVNH